MINLNENQFKTLETIEEKRLNELKKCLNCPICEHCEFKKTVENLSHWDMNVKDNPKRFSIQSIRIEWIIIAFLAIALISVILFKSSGFNGGW